MRPLIAIAAALVLLTGCGAEKVKRAEPPTKLEQSESWLKSFMDNAAEDLHFPARFERVAPAPCDDPDLVTSGLRARLDTELDLDDVESAMNRRAWNVVRTKDGVFATLNEYAISFQIGRSDAGTLVSGGTGCVSRDS